MEAANGFVETMVCIPWVSMLIGPDHGDEKEMTEEGEARTLTPPGTKCPSTIPPSAGTTRGSGNGKGGYIRIPSKITAFKYSSGVVDASLICSYDSNEVRISCCKVCRMSGFF